MKPIPANPKIIMAQADGSGTEENTPMQPFGQMALEGSAPKGTNTSPEIGSTETEWSLNVVMMFCKNVSVLLSIIPRTGPPGLLRAARNQRPVVGSNQTWSSPLT